MWPQLGPWPHWGSQEPVRPNDFLLPDSDTNSNSDNLNSNHMVSKIIMLFSGLLTPFPINTWLGQCEDMSEIYAVTKSNKLLNLNVVTKICIAGIHLQEPLTATWWSSAHAKLLKLESWKDLKSVFTHASSPRATRWLFSTVSSTAPRVPSHSLPTW